MQTILVVDDDADLCKLVVKFLDTYKVVVANDPQTGIARVRSYFPDLILLDINLPGKDGFAFLRYLKSEEKFSAIPVIMLTADRSRESVRRAVSTGAIDYIVKPFDRARLNNKVRAVGTMLDLQHNTAERSSRIDVNPKPNYIHFTFLGKVTEKSAQTLEESWPTKLKDRYGDGEIVLDFRYQKSGETELAAGFLNIVKSLEPKKCAIIAGRNYAAFVTLPLAMEDQLFISLDDYENWLNTREERKETNA